MNRLRYSLFALALLFCASTAHAQQTPTPPPRDTTKVVRDTTKAVRDTTKAARDTTGAPIGPITTPIVPDTSAAAHAFADSVKPLPQLPQIFQGPASGFADGVWVWDHTALELEATTTLADLLERIPSVLTMRAGIFLQPIAATYASATANRLEVFMNGYQLDPMLEGSIDLSKIELVNINNVRIERRTGRIRIYVTTLAAKDTRPYSRVEAGVAQPNANLFRGIFIVPKLFFGPVGVALDRWDTNANSEPANQVAGWLKWSYVRQRAGVEVEYRRNQVSRNPQSPWPDRYNRTDLMVRGRLQVAKSLVAELFAGRANLVLDSALKRADSIPRLKAEDTQLGGRVSFETPMFWANGALRLRDNEALPATQIDGAAGVRYSILSASAEATQSDWRSAGSTNELTLHAQAGPVHGLRVFGETTTSDRGASYLVRLPDTATITSFKGYRAGADFTWRGATAGAALLHIESDSVPSFGLPFDTTRNRFVGANTSGWEVSGRVPLPIPIKLLHGFAVEGMLTNWNSGFVGIYNPTRQYRAGLEYYAMPLKSGNLEILGRLEMIHRGAMIVPGASQDAAGNSAPFTQVPQVDYVDGYLQIRIIDVRAFLRYEDLTGQRVQQVLGRPLPGPRVFYGVKWQFFN
jgi:hypothetical protein